MVSYKTADNMWNGLGNNCENYQFGNQLSRDGKVRSRVRGIRHGFMKKPTSKFQALLGLSFCVLHLLCIGNAASPISERGDNGFIRHSRRLFTSDKPKGYAPPSRVNDYWTLLSHVTPSFDNNYPKNMTTQLGQTVYLHCVVNNLGDKTNNMYDGKREFRRM